jgi:hypothetical protein
MSSALLFVTLLAQSQWPDAFPQQDRKAVTSLQQVLNFSQPVDEQSAQKAALYQQFRFTTSFNHLKKALDEFADAYNQGKLDLKKIEEIKKAWRDLENSEALFRRKKSK